MWMTPKTQYYTSTTQPYSATAAKVVAKLPRKVIILMMEKAAILKNSRHHEFSVSQNKNSDSP